VILSNMMGSFRPSLLTTNIFYSLNF